VRRLTDLLTRPGSAGETARDTGDAYRGPRLVSDTLRNARDGGEEIGVLVLITQRRLNLIGRDG